VRIDFDIPVFHGRLRFAPSNCKSVIEISELAVDCPLNERVLWRPDPGRAGEIAYAGTAIRMPDDSNLIVLS